jgi:hypothetical protein
MTWKEYIDNAEKVLTEHENAINERLVKKSVVRDGKKITHWVSTKPNCRVQFDKNHNPKEHIITPTERKRRELAQRLKGKVERQGQMKNIQKQRLKSFKQRDMLGIDYNKEIPDIVNNRKKQTKMKKDIKTALLNSLKALKNKIVKFMNRRKKKKTV